MTAPSLRIYPYRSIVARLLEDAQMKGQWIGRTTGNQRGRIIFNADELENQFIGAIFTTPDDHTLPSSICFFQTENKNSNFKFSPKILPIDPRNSMPAPWEMIRSLFPGIDHSDEVVVSGNFTETELYIKAKTDLGIEVESYIERPLISEYSNISSEVKNWEEYKKLVISSSKNKFFFRGQEKPWKLRTSFHRRGRCVLSRFLHEDIPQLHQRLTAETKHVFNLQIAQENGAFISLAQHHGYPTPILDWTYSPYVAAFFAFRREVSAKHTDNDPVRIYMFDQERWKADMAQFVLLDIHIPHLSISDFLSIDNERIIPQQAVSTVTNIDDVEKYVAQMEGENTCKYLWAIDIPASERTKVMDELSYMGITAGSMFPGIDGACEELREKLFD